MKQKILIILVVLLLFAGGTFLINRMLKKSNADSTAETIILINNGGSPFQWQYYVATEGVIKIEEKTVVQPGQENLEGGEVEIHYTVIPVKTGKTTLTFKKEYIVKDENREPSEVKAYEIEVNKDLKVLLKKIQ